jgi:antitoxin component of MazEF toxin-antitoxin module
MRNENTVSVAREARLSEGDCLAMDLDRDGSIVLRSARKKYDLAELVSRITVKNRHRETDWGQPRGKESW